MVPEVVDEVKRFIDAKNLSIEKFAGLADVGESTIYRLYRGESISDKSLVSILKVIHAGNHHVVLKELAEAYPDNKNLQDAAACYKKAKYSFVTDSELKEFYGRDRLSQRLYILLTYDEGVSREIVREEMGKMGIELFDELLNKGKLTEIKPGCYRLPNNRQGLVDGELLKILGIRTFEQYDKNTYLTDDSAIGYLTGWVDEQGFGELKQCGLATGMRYLEIMERRPGRIPFAIASCQVKILNEVDFKKNSEGLS